MKNTTMNAIYTALNTIDFENKDAIMEELYAEIHRNDAAKEQKSAMYDEAWKVVANVLRSTTAPLTVAEIFAECESELPTGFTKGRIQSGLTRNWKDLVVKIEGKPNTYRIA